MNFKIEEFVKFKNSTTIDGNWVGIYKNEVVRIVKEKKDDLKEVLAFDHDFPELIKSDLISENEDILVIKHDRLDYITYFNEWTIAQKVEAALCVIELEEFLAQRGFTLVDPHSFNITFQQGLPIYFDLGSISKAKVRPYIWFVKCFCGLNEKDYWDSVLNINIFVKGWITLHLLLSSNPYNYLKNVVSKYSTNHVQRIYKSSIGSITKRKIKKILELFSKSITQWTNYSQSKVDETKQDDPRTKNFINLLNIYKPNILLDIGANKGAFAKMAIKNGVQKVIALDIDNYSIEELRQNTINQKLPIWTARINLMEYDEHPGCYKSYYPAHERLQSDFAICFALVHHLCYFGNYKFETFAFRLNRFVNKTIIVEFVPYDDIHLTGPKYKGKDRSWYTTENFIIEMKKFFPGKHEIFESTPKPRILIKFEK